MVRNIYFIAFNRYLIRKNTTNYSKSQQTTEAEAGHFLYFDCKSLIYRSSVMVRKLGQINAQAKPASRVCSRLAYARIKEIHLQFFLQNTSYAYEQSLLHNDQSEQQARAKLIVLTQ